jgi:hypothetical protein
VLREKENKPCQPRILNPAKLFFRNEEEIKKFPRTNVEGSLPPDLSYKKC